MLCSLLGLLQEPECQVWCYVAAHLVHACHQAGHAGEAWNKDGKADHCHDSCRVQPTWISKLSKPSQVVKQEESSM